MRSFRRSSFVVRLLMKALLAATHHDPEGRLYDQTARVLPALARLFGGLAIYATSATQSRSIELLSAAGARVRRELPGLASGLHSLGRPRRGAVELALGLDAPCMLFCDFDRALHWAERYPAELEQVVARAGEHDLTVLGRTARAFDSHPRIQRDTEAIINHVFASVSGRPWDVTAAARMLSRRAAAAILAGCPDETVGTDVAWPLFVARAGGLTLGYLATEGLEFETADRHAGEVATAGGLAAWIDQIDADPRKWIQRLELARIEVESALPYLGERPTANDE